MRRLRARHNLRTSPSSKDSRYLIPPQARLDELWLVCEAKSPRSISATFAPRAESAAAETAPLMPPPRMRTSKTVLPRRSRLVARSRIDYEGIRTHDPVDPKRCAAGNGRAAGQSARYRKHRFER